MFLKAESLMIPPGEDRNDSGSFPNDSLVRSGVIPGVCQEEVSPMMSWDYTFKGNLWAMPTAFWSRKFL